MIELGGEHQRSAQIESVLAGRDPSVLELVVLDVDVEVWPNTWVGRAHGGRAWALHVEGQGPRTVAVLLDALRGHELAALDPSCPPMPPCSVLLAQTRGDDSRGDFLLPEPARAAVAALDLVGRAPALYQLGRGRWVYTSDARGARTRESFARPDAGPDRFGPPDGFDYGAAALDP